MVYTGMAWEKIWLKHNRENRLIMNLFTVEVLGCKTVMIKRKYRPGIAKPAVIKFPTYRGNF
jgi:hypothetical protein